MKLGLRFETILFTLGIAFLPVYVFSSGGIQPSHMVFSTFAMIYFLRNGVSLTNWSVLLGALFLYASAIESAYTILGQDSRHLIQGAFFLYNFILSAAVYGYVRRNGLVGLPIGLTCATLIAIGTVLAAGVNLVEYQGRSTGAFNNPNQLGYFSVCLLSLTYLLYRHGKLSYLVTAGFFITACFLAIASLSKAAMAANFAVIFLAFKPRTSTYALLVWPMGAIAGITGLIALYFSGYFDEYLFIQRFANIANESDSSLAGRGYFAIFQANPLQTLIGLGSGNVSEIIGHEVHSTLGSVLNNYGLFGLGLFGGTLLIWASTLWRAYGFIGLVCITGPAMLYGITHNGIRFTIFWLLFAASLAMAQSVIKVRESRPRRRVPMELVRAPAQ